MVDISDVVARNLKFLRGKDLKDHMLRNIALISYEGKQMSPVKVNVDPSGYISAVAGEDDPNDHETIPITICFGTDGNIVRLLEMHELLYKPRSAVYHTVNAYNDALDNAKKRLRSKQ